MKLYLVQHGDALSETIDPRKPLSPKGEKDVQRLGQALRSFAVDARMIIHSGKLRAQQSAEILGQALGLPVREVAGLNPLDPVKPFAREREESGSGAVVVGHLPFMERLASLLLADREEPAIVRFQRGGMVCLERAGDGPWCLLWTAFPDQPRL